MAKRKYGKKRRSRKRRKRKRRRRTRISRQLLGNKYFTTHSYVTQFQLQPTSSGPDHHIFRLNNVYDPDYTATGHQPYLYDQVKQFYEHVTVLKSNMTVHFIPYRGDYTAAGSRAGNFQVGLLRSADLVWLNAFGTGFSNKDEAVEGGTTKCKLLSETETSKALSIGFNAKKHMQNKSSNLGGTGYGDSSEHGPSEDIYGCVWVANVAASTGNPVTVLVRINYTCMYEHPVKVGTS